MKIRDTKDEYLQDIFRRFKDVEDELKNYIYDI